MKNSLLLCLYITLFSVLVACTDYASKKVKFIIPNNFRGSILLIFTNKGIELPNDSMYVYIKVPSSGVLRIKDIELFLRPTQVDAEYVNGKKIPVEVADTNGRNAPPDDFLLRTSYSTEGPEGREMWWTLGTYEDVKKTKLKMIYGDKVTSTSEIPNSPPL